jgi:deoxyribodipyrimidine photolyase
MLRQFAFREMTIIQARRANLTMESSIDEWAKAFLTPTSYDNLISRENSESKLKFHHIQLAKTGDKLIDKILKESYKVGVMPNRARMFFAGWLFYNAPTGMDALKWLMGTFDLFLIDGQCPTNYIQSVSSMNMQYGKVMLLNRNNVENLLQYETKR